VINNAGSPTAAERARSIVASAATLRVTTESGPVDLIGSHLDPGDGTVLIAAAGSALAAEMRSAAEALEKTRTQSPGDLPELVASVELADLSPVPTRSRVRARLRLSGWLRSVGTGASDDRELLCMEPAEVLLDDRGELIDVEPEDFAAARPDPLAAAEADLLSHLQASHGQEIAALTRLVPPAALHGVVRVLPLALDRCGLVLRAERVRDFSDVRLPFRTPVTDLASAQVAFRDLVELSRQVPRRPSFGPQRR
jgi:hypothetical protein